MKKIIDYIKNIIKSIKESPKKYQIFLYISCALLFIVIALIAIVPQKEIPYQPTAFSVFGFDIQWYALFILSGIIIAIILATNEFKKKGVNIDDLFTLILIIVPSAIIGCRIYYVLFDPSGSYDSFLDVINIRNGGLAIHGGIIVTFALLIPLTRWKKTSFFLYADICATYFIIGQIAGRWGNFMNHELYGPAIESNWIINIIPEFIKKNMVVGGVVHHPTFLYEGIWNFVGFLLLLNLKNRIKGIKVGDTLGFYLIWYGLGRAAIIEPLRIQGATNDALRFMGLPINIIMSYGMVVLGIVYLIAKRYIWKNLVSYQDYHEPDFTSLKQLEKEETTI
jgi:phosphatidylglycerol:prolipoprotein diacylglycerol transferase